MARPSCSSARAGRVTVSERAGEHAEAHGDEEWRISSWRDTARPSVARGTAASVSPAMTWQVAAPMRDKAKCPSCPARPHELSDTFLLDSRAVPVADGEGERAVRATVTTDSTLSAESGTSGSTCCCAPSACSQRSSARRRSRNAARTGGSREPVAVSRGAREHRGGRALAQGAARDREPFLPRRHRRGTQDPKPEVDVAGVDRPVHGEGEVLLLGSKAVRDLDVSRTHDLLTQLPAERDVVLSVTSPQRCSLAILVEAFLAVLADGLQQPIAVSAPVSSATTNDRTTRPTSSFEERVSIERITRSRRPRRRRGCNHPRTPTGARAAVARVRSSRS